jgi:hypothetical protein
VKLADVIEQAIAAAANKNPQVRSETALWLVRCFGALLQPPAKSEVKDASELCVKVHY